MKSLNEFPYIPTSGIICIPEGAILRLYFDIAPYKPYSDTDGVELPSTAKLYVCENVDVKGRSYSQIVSAIVNDRYTADDFQALEANYIEAKDENSDVTDAKRSEYLAEYAEFQAWRKKAKAIAAEVIEML